MYMRIKSDIKVYCEECNKQFITKSYRVRRFCCIKCKNRYVTRVRTTAKEKHKKTCIVCGKKFVVACCRKDVAKFCSNRCKGIGSQGSNNKSWKGGRVGDGDGYIMVMNKKHPYSNNQGYVREHRLVMEKKVGRYLKPWEVVHHKNGIRDDNRLKNLELITQQKNIMYTRMSIECPKCHHKFNLK